MPQLPPAELLGKSAAPIARPGRGPVRHEPAYDIVFVDRDGTVNVHRPGYVADPADLVLLPGAAAAIRALNDAGCAVVLITNQRGLATGRLTEAQLLSVHEKLIAELADAGAHLDGIEVCPHEHGQCDCRKPLPGMFHRALRRARWADPARCVMIGDQESDLVPATALGMATVQVGGSHPGLAEVVAQLFKTTRGTRFTVRKM